MPKDWVYAVAVAPDNQTVAAGGWDGVGHDLEPQGRGPAPAFVPGRDE